MESKINKFLIEVESKKSVDFYKENSVVSALCNTSDKTILIRITDFGITKHAETIDTKPYMQFFFESYKIRD